MSRANRLSDGRQNGERPFVVSLLKGETSVAEAARKHALTVAEIEDWRDRFLVGAENALRSRPKDEEAQRRNRSRS